MAFTVIDPTIPTPQELRSLGDDRIREFKQQVVDNLTEITNYPASTKPALKTTVWTTATRPSGAELVDRVTGYNTDLGCEEYYDVASSSWKQKTTIPAWSVSGRPSSPYVGQYGYNTDLDVIERWNGSAWVRISGWQRGFIMPWGGSASNIPTGWVLCDGVTRSHPEGGTFTPPDLRDKFLAGAGNSYAVGATGGEAFHTLSVNEIPSHAHSYTGPGGTYQVGHGDTAWVTGFGGQTTGYTGGGQPHENRPPYYALCFLYKL